MHDVSNHIALLVTFRSLFSIIMALVMCVGAIIWWIRYYMMRLQTRTSLPVDNAICQYCAHTVHHNGNKCKELIDNVHDVCICAVNCMTPQCHAGRSCGKDLVCRHISSALRLR